MAIPIGDRSPVHVREGLGDRQLALMQQRPEPRLVALLVFLLSQSGTAVGEREAEGFWRQFLDSLNERILTDSRLLISAAHHGQDPRVGEAAGDR